MLHRLVAGATAILYIGACTDGSSPSAESTAAALESSTEPAPPPPTRRGTTGQVGLPPPTLPGTLPGSLEVSATGAATYHIPLEVAPGVRGMAPSLALSYSSGRGNGILGMGWELEGLSSIHRCTRDLRRDGFEAPITFRDEDRLCLDGQRLVPLDPISHGQGGAEYRGELAPNLRIVGNGPISASGSSFTVYYPDGRIATYGESSDATVEVYDIDADGSEAAIPFRWALRRVEDRYRNRIEYSYASTKAKGLATDRWFDIEHRITAITYAESRAVNFYYERRPDVIAGYFSGVFNQMSLRMRQINVSVSGAPFRSYRMTYDASAAWPEPFEWIEPPDRWYGFYFSTMPASDTGRSRIESLRECNGDGTVCKPATQLTWHTGATGDGAVQIDHDFTLDGVAYPTPADVNVNEPDVLRQLVGDFDHDGAADLLIAQQYNLQDQQGTWKLWSTKVTGQSFHRVDTQVKVRFFPTFETRPGVFGTRFFREIGVPTAQVINYDGRRGADVAAVLPAARLGGMLDDHAEPLFDGDLVAHPGFVGDGFQIVRQKPDGTWEETLLHEPSGHHMLYSHWLNLDGDGLTDLLYCKGVVDVEQAYAEAENGQFLLENYRWTAGRLHYVVNRPGVGIDFANAQPSNRDCAIKDKVQIFDVDGDGDDEFLRIGHGGSLQVYEVEPDKRVEPEEWDPYYTVFEIDVKAGTIAVMPLDHPIPTDYLQRIRGQGFTRYGIGTDLKGDFNGDGLVDLVRFQLAEGDTAANLPGITAIRKFGDAFEWPDSDLDGVASTKHEAGGVHLFINTGRGLIDTRSAAITNTFEAAAYWRHFLSAFPMDYNGDGITDLMMRDPRKERGDGIGEDPVDLEPGDPAHVNVFFGGPRIHQPGALIRWAATPIPHQFDRWHKSEGNSCEGESDDDDDGWDGSGMDEDGTVYDEDGEPIDDDGWDEEEEEEGEEEEECGPWTVYRVFVPRRHYLAMDGNGDGLTDVLTFNAQDWLEDTDAHLQLWAHAGAHRFDVLSTVTNGLAAIDRVEYKPIGDPWGIYRRQEWRAPAEQPAPPATTIATGPLLVHRLFRDSGILVGIERRWEYQYRNARADLTDGSFLGFEFVKSVESRNGFPDDGNHPDYDNWRRVEQTYYDNHTYDPVTKRFPYAGRMLGRVRLTEADGYQHANEPQHVYQVVKVGQTYAQGATDLPATYRADLTSRSTEEYRGHFFDVYDNDLFCLLVAPASCEDAPDFDGGWLDNFPVKAEREVLSSFDVHGQAWRIDTTLLDGTKQVIERSYQNDTQNWLIGFPTSEKITSTTTLGSETRHRTTAYTPQGSVHFTITEPDDPAYKLSVLYEYNDPHGNPTKETLVTATDWGTRHMMTAWTSDGVFPMTRTNALGQTTWFGYHPGFGTVASVLLPNGNTTTYAYNDVGYLAQTQTFGVDLAPLEKPTIHEYWQADPEPGVRFTGITSKTEGYGETTITFDRLGRPVRRVATGADGSPVYQDTKYDVMGRVDGVSLPTFDQPVVIGAPGLTYTTIDHDFIDRPRRVVAADQTETRFEYGQDLEVTRIDAEGRRHWKRFDQLGRPTSWRDGVDEQASTPSELMCAEYGAFGTLRVLRPCHANPDKAPVTMDYDRYGRRTRLTDAQLGTTTNTYNAYGELASVTDGNGRVVRYFHDAIGRVYERWDGANAEEGVASWFYDQDVPGTLSESMSPDGHHIRYGYDWGHSNRLTTVRWTVDDDTAYEIRYEYDPEHDRVAVIHYPHDEEHDGFAVRREYDGAGRLTRVTSGDDDTAYWTRVETNVFDQIVAEQFGNGVMSVRGYDPANARLLSITSTSGQQAFQELAYEWSPAGALDKRTNSGSHLLLPQIETFVRDGLDRVVTATRSDGVHVDAMSFTYDSVGNLRSRTGLEEYTYEGERLVAVSGSEYEATYEYDANGNRIKQTSGGDTLYTYNLANKIARIEYGADAGARDLRFTYDANGNLIRQHEVNDGESSTFILGLFERHTNAKGQIEDIYSIHGPSGVVAQVTRSYEPGDSYDVATRYIHADHLGSANVVTDEAGQPVERLDYGVFGERRQAVWFGNGSPLPESQVRVGYTGHDNTLEALGLVNMKGRLYDPSHGRFIQADPIIQAPFFNQSPNRYAYVLNNPLTRIDPTGYVSVDGDGEPVVGLGTWEDDGSVHVTGLDGGAWFRTEICVGCDDESAGLASSEADDFGLQLDFGEDSRFDGGDVGPSALEQVNDIAGYAGHVFWMAGDMATPGVIGIAGRTVAFVGAPLAVAAAVAQGPLKQDDPDLTFKLAVGPLSVGLATGGAVSAAIEQVALWRTGANTAWAIVQDGFAVAAEGYQVRIASVVGGNAFTAAGTQLGRTVASQGTTYLVGSSAGTIATPASSAWSVLAGRAAVASRFLGTMGFALFGAQLFYAFVRDTDFSQNPLGGGYVPDPVMEEIYAGDWAPDSAFADTE